MSDYGYISLGLQAKPAGAPTTVVTSYPVIGPTQESCEICDRVDERDNMFMVGLKYGEFEVYVCDQAHPKDAE